MLSSYIGDKQRETSALHDLLNYVRKGDNIIVEDIKHLSNTAGGFIDLAIKLKQQGVNIICSDQKIDTSMSMWDMMFSYLTVFIEQQSDNTRGRSPRNIEDLDDCFELVEQGKMTVKEVCKQLNIGKNTYYRRWRQVVKVNQEPVEKHPERFEEFESLVAQGKITVTEAARQMNIGITTYYRMRKAQSGG